MASRSVSSLLWLSEARLQDEAAVVRRNRYSRLQHWATAVVLEQAALAVDIAEDGIEAAAHGEAMALREELSAAGLLDDLPQAFGSGRATANRDPDPDGLMGRHNRSRQANKQRRRRQAKAATTTATTAESWTGASTTTDVPSTPQPPPAPLTIEAGLECYVFNDGDYLWYTAVVVRVMDDATCDVRFHGYDGERTVPFTWVQARTDAPTADSGCVSGGESIGGASGGGVGSNHSDVLAVVAGSGGEHQDSAPCSTATADTQDNGGDVSFGATGDGAHRHMEHADDLASTTLVPQAKLSRKSRANWSAPDARNPYEKTAEKYWAQRFRLFSLFDRGIKLDDESFFSITPEIISKHIAERCRCGVLLDPFCGVGGNVIQFAFTCHHVIAVDIDPAKIAAARHNARIYGVADRIEFIVGDSVAFMASLSPGKAVDVVYLSPPWGGPAYLDADEYNVRTMIRVGAEGDLGIDGEELFHLARRVSKDVAYFLPRTTPPSYLASLVSKGEGVEVENQFINGKLKTLTAYYGELAVQPTEAP